MGASRVHAMHALVPQQGRPRARLGPTRVARHCLALQSAGAPMRSQTPTPYACVPRLSANEALRVVVSRGLAVCVWCYIEVCLMFFNHSEELRHARDTTNDPASDRFRTRRFTGTPQTASCGCMHRTQRAGAIIRDRDRARTNTADGAEGGRRERETVTGACVASEAEDPISARR